MTNIKIKYPLLIIREKDGNLYGLKKNIGLVSKGGQDFYERKMIIIDSNGNKLSLISAELYGKAKLMDSLKWFQPMLQMNLTLEKIDNMSLEQVKGFIIEYINRKPKRWLSMGTVEGLTESINERTSISELANMFR